MKPPFPSVTSEWHNAPYAAISPTLPALSVAGKTVLMTGGGRGIGSRIAYAFAAAGAKIVAITGRTAASLEESKAAIEKDFPNVTVVPLTSDVTDAEAINTAFAKIAAMNGGIHICVHNAGVAPPGAKIAEISNAAARKDWWNGYEINVLGTLVVLNAFAQHKAQGAKLCFIGTAASAVFPSTMLGTSAYSMSKSAAAVLVQYFAAENPEIGVFTLHPGVVLTEMGSRGKKSGNTLPTDDIDLPAHFAVWLLSPEGEFLRNRFVWCNWDVNELKEKTTKITETKGYLNIGMIGWPYRL
ncbi:NAD(P)-binding protein [Microthyrium microscopicum]|uniref:NAD(P)-binding protein n=1 Tax=Microthyrium microscopicum TaxID=703497 RepID=A0A6A6UFK7_9PEZI|nr:NAD(P)-binding protein [Microthyrium microscopicum]